jgi:LysR family transcriptional regulator, glycine cleavage system transcriptional activator
MGLVVAVSHLKALQALEAAIRLGSLKKAADALVITPAAVGQRVKALENYLGIDLVVRGRSGLRATPELATALGPLSTAFKELSRVADLLNLQRRDEIHIAAPSDFEDLWLKPRLDRFRRAHNNVSFCINGEGDAPHRLGRVDCEFAFGPIGTDRQFELLFHDFMVPVCSPEIAGRLAKSKSSLEGLPLLHLDFYKNDSTAPRWPTWIAAGKIRRTAPNRGIRFQRIALGLEAVLSDAGLMICGLALARDLIESRRLVLPFPFSKGAMTQHAFQARFRGDLQNWPQLKRFRSWLLEESAATRTWLTRASTRKRVAPAAAI